MGYPTVYRELKQLVEDVALLTSFTRKIGRKMGMRFDATEEGGGVPGPPGNDGDDAPSRLFRGFRAIPHQPESGLGEEVTDVRWYIDTWRPDIGADTEWGTYGSGASFKELSFRRFDYTTFLNQAVQDPNFPDDPPLPIFYHEAGGTNTAIGSPPYAVFVVPYEGIWRLGGGMEVYFLHTIRAWASIRARVTGPSGYIYGLTGSASFELDEGYGEGGSDQEVRVTVGGTRDIYLRVGDKVSIVGAAIGTTNSEATGQVQAFRLQGPYNDFFTMQYMGLPWDDGRGSEAPIDPGSTSNLAFDILAPGRLTVEDEVIYLDWDVRIGSGSTHTLAEMEDYIESVLTDPQGWAAQLGITPRKTSSANVLWWSVAEASCPGTDVGCTTPFGDGSVKVEVENSHFGNVLVANHEAGHAYFGAQHTSVGIMQPMVTTDPIWPTAGDVADVQNWLNS